MNEDQIRNNAVSFAKANKANISRRIASLEKFPQESNPVSVFMAGSPGAGKTEASIKLLEKFPRDKSDASSDLNVVRIDADELRSEFPEYTGNNSDLFQGAVSILIDRIHDLVLKQSQSFILDGTLSNLDKASQNIERSLKRNRLVQIYYVYQTPQQAWSFVEKREVLEGRHIPVESFIDQYFKSRKNANYLKKKFGNQVRLDILMKNIDGTDRLYRSGVDQIDNHIPEKYSELDIKSFIEQNM